jgi:TonB-linked SusC/RagA family outer membrane protein
MKRFLMLKALLFVVGLLLSIGAFAQQMTVKGHVKDATGEPVIGANVLIKGTTSGVITDFDGNFVLQAKQGDVVVISFVGYQAQELPVQPVLNVVLKDDSQLLQDVVVIGYGTVKKNDATGSVTAIKVEDKNKGLTVSPQDMIAGKVAGVNVATPTGQPGGSASIRIRGGSSLTASNDPLIVIDGVIMGSGKIDGFSNPLSSVNPNDIESFTVLKDASATAIYGSRASNGVIIITTKKGKSGSVKLSYSGNVSLSTPKKKIEVMNAGEFRDFVKNMPDATEAMKKAVDSYPDVDTNWQDEVLRTAVSTEHNISAYGSMKDFLPYRVSLGYTNQNGILKTSNFERYSGSLSLTPKLFDDHLNMNLNAKGIYIKNRFADVGAMVGAVSFDPTKPVRNNNTKFGGYYTWTNDGTPNGTKASSAGINPVSLLEMTNDRSKVKSFIGNAQFDYKLHFFPELRLNLNLGMDYTKSDGNKIVNPIAPSGYGEDPQKSGSHYIYSDERKNTLFDFYAQYSKDFANQHFDVMGGYSYQKYHKKVDKETWYLSREEATFGQHTTLNGDRQPSESQYVLLSFYGRLNYIAFEKYLFTFTLRDDASSRFAKKNRWGLFPAVALGWKINEENFMKELKNLNELKLRLGWGVTGQQDLGPDISDYPYMSFWRYGQGGAMYPFYDASGKVKWINVVSPSPSSPDLKWEQTTTYNVGIDYGFFNNRINGAIDFYVRKTKDLINAEVNVPAGTDFAEYVVANIGSLKNTGAEFSINAKPIVSETWNWDLGFNVAWNKSEITKLDYNDNTDSPGKRFESTGGDGAKTVKIHSVGYAPGSYYVFEQAYDSNGKALEGVYVDRNGDGEITEKDLYHHYKPTPDVTMGFNTKLSYKNWDFGFNGRVSLGNYNYNGILANSAVGISQIYSNSALSNQPKAVFDTNFEERRRLSDYFIQNASFLKIDNITLGYSFDNLMKGTSFRGLSGRMYATVQNPITITKYKGLDPEVDGGMDRDVYPRPVSFLFGVNINF